MNTKYWVGKYDVHGVIYQHDGPHDTQEQAETALKMLTVMNKVDKFDVIGVTKLKTEAQKEQERIDSEVDDVCEFLFGCSASECRPDVGGTVRAMVEAGFKRQDGKPDHTEEINQTCDFLNDLFGPLSQDNRDNIRKGVESAYDEPEISINAPRSIPLDMSMYDFSIQCDGGAFDMAVKEGEKKRRNAIIEMLKDVDIHVTPELVDRPNPFTLGMIRHSQVTMAKKLVDAGYIKGIN